MPGVYLSYPFCSQKCTYCNFASGVQPRELEQNYLDTLIAEIAGHDWRWNPDTIYWGGGTPSRIAPEHLARVHRALPGAPWLEATLEAAPGEITAEAARAWRSAGINRVSLGVQSFVTRELRQTARRHTADTVAADVATLGAAGIRDVNIDLIAGLPYQTAASWRESLEWIARLNPTHVSVYMLEVDEDSRLGLEILGQGSRYGAAAVPSEELTVELYEHAIDELARQGIHQYEISNFARPGHESRHNLKYWRLEPYAGFGADAHSFDNGVRWQNVESAAGYVERLRRGQSARTEQVSANPAEERFFVGLRLREGIEPEAADWVRFAPQIERFLKAGLLERTGARLRLTRRGVLLSNEVFEEFIEAA
ncbi:MAG: radical SAM family heme chaperone HemW [Bryobacterales bacterium]|nr:radical SAM family heme chaperone HemW [Bryobacterales bacterium]